MEQLGKTEENHENIYQQQKYRLSFDPSTSNIQN
jgi:hypothetical protein